MPPKKPIPTLRILSDVKKLRALLESTLHEVLGIKNKFVIPSEVGKKGSTSYFVSSLAEDVATIIREVGEDLGRKEFKDFNSDTKLTPEIVEEIWMGVSSFLGRRVERLYNKSGANEIPGLRELIEERPLLPGEAAYFQRGDREHKVHAKEYRKRMTEKMNSLNDASLFVAKFRNNYFEYFQGEYKAFPEQEIDAKYNALAKSKSELARGIKMR
jgi:hypothetical protein